MVRTIVLVISGMTKDYGPEYGPGQKSGLAKDYGKKFLVTQRSVSVSRDISG